MLETVCGAVRRCKKSRIASLNVNIIIIIIIIINIVINIIINVLCILSRHFYHCGWLSFVLVASRSNA